MKSDKFSFIEISGESNSYEVLSPAGLHVGKIFLDQDKKVFYFDCTEYKAISFSQLKQLVNFMKTKKILLIGQTDQTKEVDENGK